MDLDRAALALDHVEKREGQSLGSPSDEASSFDRSEVTYSSVWLLFACLPYRELVGSRGL